MSDSKRLQWLDAMRGFTMILVVAYHVAQMSFHVNEKTSTSLPFLVLFRMPLFFFVSGFLAYKADFLWNWGNTLRLTWKKIKIQVIPAFVFLCVFIILRKDDFQSTFEYAMRSATKCGYWFTWGLLQMFLIYYIACLCQRHIKRYPNLVIWILWLLSIFVYETLYLPKVFTFHEAPFFRYSSLIKTMNYMQFFLFGNLIHRHWNKVQQIFSSAWFFPILTIVAFVCCADIFRWHTMKFAWTNLPRTLAMYSLLTIVVIFFRHYQSWFTNEKRIGRGLQYIGVRTLDIYLLHDILLPRWHEVGAWFDQHHPNFLIEIVCFIGVALVVIAFCLLVSQILRISPFFRLYLFGRK